MRKVSGVIPNFEASLWQLKKNDSRGAKLSMSIPRSTHQRAYSSPSARLKASSWMAVEPASRMWYPEIEMLFQSGISREANSIVSTTRRMLSSCG